LKIAEAKADLEEKNRSLTHEAATLSDAFRRVKTLEEKIDLVLASHSEFTEVHQLSRELSDLEAQKKTLSFTPGLPEADQQILLQLSRAISQLRTRLSKLAAGVRKANERVLQKVSRSISTTPPRHLLQTETSLLNDTSKCKASKA
jgi:predicted  nucleic acid-binding Zn-ribbon protein